MARLRSNFKTGTLTAAITSGDTSLSSGGFTSLPSVSGSERLALVLDPAGSAGAPEVVWVTSHGAGTSTVTVTRGQEGTTARSHASGTVWRHSPTAIDFPAVTTSGTILLSHEVYEGRMRYNTDTNVLQIYDGAAWVDIADLDTITSLQLGAWTAYTPTWTNLSVGNGTVTARYRRIGRSILYQGSLQWGSTTSATGAYMASLPVNVVASRFVVGSAVFEDASASSARYSGNSQLYTPAFGQSMIFTSTGNAGWGTTTPVTPASGDLVVWSIEYEAAS